MGASLQQAEQSRGSEEMEMPRPIEELPQTIRSQHQKTTVRPFTSFEVISSTHSSRNLERHPNLAMVIAGCTNEELATLYEYVHGRSVADVIKTNPSLLTPEAVIKVERNLLQRFSLSLL
jgi:hypothetical protein